MYVNIVLLIYKLYMYILCFLEFILGFIFDVLYRINDGLFIFIYFLLMIFIERLENVMKKNFSRNILF